MKQPANLLQTALLLRLAAILAFPAGVVLAALMERSFLMVAVLAAGMVMVSWIERLRLFRLAGNDERPDLSGLLPGFAWRFGLLAGVFILSLGVMALFRDTALSRSFGLVDLGVLVGVTGIALIANSLSARIATDQLGTTLSHMRAGFGARGANDNAGSSDVIEGEVIHRDEPS